ncbi:thioesterase family protein [Myxococcus stipitatus DSM 14675]|uniref:Thioesterase family protein n=1 Tax=Myxococcus stipitatus (strain DSM 14675 / JCM 12634 / Mx s8) TaxID=1278073 RepID=L7U584_MYXSD|nr:PaaI family thioesterase [Myxococcus stipitatus]AGC42975.1 thioesterase family protein [Myxococcus stipitatus DSM 14675]
MSDSSSGPPTRPTQAALDRYAELFNQSLTLRHFGARLSFPEGRNKVVVTLPELRPEHRGGVGSALAVNGGILAALFDLAIGTSGALVDPTRRCATVQLSMSFERPVTGDRLRVESEIDSQGLTLLFATARVYDAQDRVCGRCQGVVRLSNLPWASGESPATN